MIDRETAIALAKEAGMAGMLTDVVCSLEEIHRLCNLAVAHSRKDAEPVDIRAAMKRAFNLGQTYWQQADSEYVSQQNKSDATRAKFNELLESTMDHVSNPPEADKPNPLEDLNYAKMMVRSSGYSLVSADFINSFAEFIQDWRKGDFDLPKLAALDVKACFDAWQAGVNQAEVKPTKEPNPDGTDYVSDREFDALISELQIITEEARATDYHDTLRKAALFLNLLKSKVHEYAKDIVRIDAACAEQHAAYTSAHSRLNEADKLLQQALEALEYRLQQTRPIHQADSVMEAIRTYLEGKK